MRDELLRSYRGAVVQGIGGKVTIELVVDGKALTEYRREIVKTPDVEYDLPDIRGRSRRARLSGSANPFGDFDLPIYIPKSPHLMPLPLVVKPPRS